MNDGLLVEYRKEAETRAAEIFVKFRMFTEGTRVLLLLLREKDGGSHNEFKRRVMTEPTHSPEQFLRRLQQMIYFALCSDEPYRIYCTVNSRNPRVAERILKERMLAIDFADAENRRLFYERLEYRWHSALMDNHSRISKYFLLDVDNGEHDIAQVESDLAEKGIKVVFKTETKNGHHLVSEPFNPALITSCDIQKDSQVLLFWK